MLARMVSRKMSKAAERQSLLMFVALQKGIYGKKDLFTYQQMVRTGQKEWSVKIEDLGSVMYNM